MFIQSTDLGQQFAGELYLDLGIATNAGSLVAKNSSSF